MILAKDQNGFTITELLIAVVVAGILSVLMISVFIYSYGSLVVEQTRSSMILESQLFLRKMTEDIRVANEVLATNTITDDNGPGGGWVTSDPANILIMTQPAVDTAGDFIYDDATGYPYQNEIVYFGDGSEMFRRTLKNTLATDNVAITTCPSGTPSCPPDIELSENLKNMTFEFYDIDDNLTTVIADARSVALTVNLEKSVYGNVVDIQNSTRMTLRNEK